jgi:prepilin-type N-terminal cleavage/methylation domain-containing protein
MRNKGFTLIELLAVMAIMLVLSGITAVAYRGFIGSTAMTSAVSQMRQTLQLARQTAIVNGKDVYVVFWQHAPTMSNWYTTCMFQGYVTDSSNANQIVDRYNPELATAVQVNSEMFNLSEHTAVFAPVTSVNVIDLPLPDFTMSNACMVTTAAGAGWSIDDKYGLEIRKRMQLPRGFVFVQNPPVSVRFKPTGEAENVAVGPGSTWRVVIREAVKPANIARVTVDPFGYVRVEL